MDGWIMQCGNMMSFTVINRNKISKVVMDNDTEFQL